MTLSERVAARYLRASRLRLGPGKLDLKNSEALSRSTLKAKNRGDISSAVTSAGYYAKKTGKTMYVYSGNSFGHAVWRVAYKASEYLDPINNTGSFVLSVTPDLQVSKHEVSRP